MNSSDILQSIPDLEITVSVARFNFLIMDCADPQPLRHLFLRQSLGLARRLKIRPHGDHPFLKGEFVMKTVLEYVGLAGLLLSLFNLLHSLWMRRLKLRADNCILVCMDENSFLLECCVSNLSAVTISVLQVKLKAGPDMAESINMQRSIRIGSERVISDFPLNVLPGEARRIALLFSHQELRQQFFGNAPADLNPAEFQPDAAFPCVGIRLVIDTPRRSARVSASAAIVPGGEWTRRYA